ncbi:hypothetical protein B0H66DRAFT_109635 [Apodospora peruviana]|uniref:Tyrosinase copper-binding domain-containing protein n=1 Tax=Apodospora peruviana TaxID=516989 RepID=A0AAE0MAJ9_9PEZI|nr:hypothetical protein B0H66DRAFT_109635 [Apodospora peruviana]
MHTPFLALLVLAQAASLALGSAVPRAQAESDLERLANLAQQAFETAQDDVTSSDNVQRGGGSSCTLSKLSIRREWGTLSTSDKKAYITAVKCLQSKPANYPASVAPGAKTRFDDFVATHINQTLSIHYTGNFLGWHRYYIWIYEQALRSECGYKGSLPYWDWSKSAITGLAKSPVFDGSATSMSGDGVAIPNQPDIVLGAGLGLPPLYLPPGTGGGCVTSGPFVDMKVNLGPVALDSPGGISVSNPDGPLAYNPRCLKRSLTDYCNQKFANATSVLSLILTSPDITTFQMTMEGVPGSGQLGVHGGGHYSMGGDPGRDVFASPADPAFYLHHAMIDRTWWIWQQLSPNKRQFTNASVGLTRTFMNMPPSPPATLDDMVDYSYAGGPPRRLGDLMSTTSGPFCYVYL